ncbi:YeeE/YedE family protein family [miscellaneous Crenarchaeota group-15 archaeon DG-45]|uniref:YeeE/YedE family protein family n=1 Tax=miscellaneous Crenarchaeota group-15 archaeon DG-45 TaxID=1685127 RepID=A0A0M0BLE9_9ARCH|nr:MAG: YeeE/YedE family protein family [miscellaneous Crenarchaeota group-15 archaeon DG-45]
MFPLGIYPYIIGGLIIGIGVALVFIMTGQHATQSSFFSSTLSYFSKLPYFQRKTYLDTREWRLYFAAGVTLGAAIYASTFSLDGFWTTKVQLWRIIIGGFLVGFGTRLSSGCTSGHGISGVASLSTTSLYAVITFILFGIVSAQIVRFLGVLP